LYEDEEHLWEVASRLEEKIESNDLLYRNQQLDAYLQAVSEHILLQATDRPGISAKIRVLRNPGTNAFVLPNGATYISTGMLVLIENEAQLATVIGHELTHYLYRHSLMQTRSAENKQKWSAVFGVLIAGAGGDSLGGEVASLWAAASLSGYSRELETAADNKGLSLTIQAGYDPKEAPKVFENLLAASDEREDDLPYFFASHPRLRERILNYRSLIDNRYSQLASSRDLVKKTVEYLDSIDPMILDNVAMDIDYRQWRNAELTINRFLERHPDSARAYFLKGEISRKTLDGERGYEVALSQYHKAMALEGTPAETYKSAGWVYRAQGDHARAGEVFRRYLSESPDAIDAPIISSYLIDTE
jgi:predicted Zn-dependent protease